MFSFKNGKKQLRLLGLCLACLLFSFEVQAGLIKIGVRAHRGVTKALQQWQPTADYLSTKIPEHEFIVVPVTGINDLMVAVDHDEFDFVLTNPSVSMEMEVKSGISALVTLANKRQGKPYTRFGSVIFTRADRKDINSIKDLKNKRFIAVAPQGFGGWLVAKHEMIHHGLIPEKDFKSLAFANGIQEDVVVAVKSGDYDAGVVRTDMLERLEQDGLYKMSDFKIINPRVTEGFPFAHSTELYPEWPFSKLKKTSNQLAQKVALALLTMPKDHAAAIAGQYVGWTVVEDYQPVRSLLKELKVGVFNEEPDSQLQAMLEKNTNWIIAVGVLLLVCMGGVVYILTQHRLVAQQKNARSRLQQRLDEKDQVLECLFQLSGLLNQQDDIDHCLEGVVKIVWPFASNDSSSLRLVYKDREYTSDNFMQRPYRVTAEIRENGSLAGLLELSYEENINPDEKKYVQQVHDLLNEIAVRLTHYLNSRQAANELQNMNAELEKRVEERTHELNLAKENAEMVSQKKSEFMSRMGEELQAPLHQLLYTIKQLEKVENISLSHEDAKQMRSDVRSLLTLVEDVLELAAIEAGHYQLTLEYVDVHQLINNTMDGLIAKAEDKNISLLTSISNNVHSVKTDQAAIRQILIHYGENAIKYNKPGGQVEFVVSSEDEEIIFSVVDNGHGIAERQKALVFNEFERLGRDASEEGSGMGLSIVKKLADVLGGRVGVETIEGRGSRFWIALPRAGV